MNGVTFSLARMVCWTLVALAPGVFAPPRGYAEDDDWRVRVLPARVVARASAGTDDASVAALRKILDEAGLTRHGPTIVDVPAVSGARKRVRRLHQEIVHAEDALPASRGGITFHRIPAVLVLERARPAGTAGTLPSVPAAALRARGLRASGRVALVPPEAGGVPARERWVVRPRGRADIGLYTDRGAHPNAVRTAAAACLAAGWTVVPLVARDLNDGSFAPSVRCLVMPGGWAEPFTRDIDRKGRAHIRRFVDRGGGYVGICAGAFFACDRIRWQGTPIDYPLDLVDAVASGPLDAIAPWPQHALATIRHEGGHPLVKGMPRTRRALYLGGCSFEPRGDNTAMQVVARYVDGGAPAVVTLARGRGRIFLSGVHLEYDLTSARDDLTWPERDGLLEDPESDWDLFQRGVRYALAVKR